MKNHDLHFHWLILFILAFFSTSNVKASYFEIAQSNLNCVERFTNNGNVLDTVCFHRFRQYSPDGKYFLLMEHSEPTDSFAIAMCFNSTITPDIIESIKNSLRENIYTFSLYSNDKREKKAELSVISYPYSMAWLKDQFVLSVFGSTYSSNLKSKLQFLDLNTFKVKECFDSSASRLEKISDTSCFYFCARKDSLAPNKINVIQNDKIISNDSSIMIDFRKIIQKKFKSEYNIERIDRNGNIIVTFFYNEPYARIFELKKDSLDELVNFNAYFDSTCTAVPDLVKKSCKRRRDFREYHTYNVPIQAKREGKFLIIETFRACEAYSKYYCSFDLMTFGLMIYDLEKKSFVNLPVITYDETTDPKIR